MTRMGQGIGLDLSPAVDALLLEGERHVSQSTTAYIFILRRAAVHGWYGVCGGGGVLKHDSWDEVVRRSRFSKESPDKLNVHSDRWKSK